MGASCSSQRLSKICNCGFASSVPDTGHKARLKDTAHGDIDVDFGEDSKSHFELDPHYLDVLMKFNQSMTPVPPTDADVIDTAPSFTAHALAAQPTMPMLAGSMSLDSMATHSTTVTRQRSASEKQRFPENSISSSIAHNRRLSSITATAAANGNDLRRLKLEIKAAYEGEEDDRDEKYIDSDDSASETPLTPTLTSAASGAYGKAPKAAKAAKSLKAASIDDDLSVSSTHNKHGDATMDINDDASSTTASVDSDRNIFRGDTNRAWDDTKLDELHQEMAEELAELSRRESVDIVNTQRSLSGVSVMSGMGPLGMNVVSAAPLHAAAANAAHADDNDSDDFNLGSLGGGGSGGGGGVMDDIAATAADSPDPGHELESQVPQSELFRVESDAKWSANKVDKKFKEMEKQMVHLATINAAPANTMGNEEFE